MKLPPLAMLLAAIALPSPAADAPPLGRLFLTPEQRQAIDRNRQRHLLGDDSEVVIDGEVRRSDGPNTRWINGVADWHGSGSLPPLPVGTTYFPSTGEHEDLLRDGRLVIDPASGNR